MTILGLQSFGRFRAERRFNATHGWAPRFDRSRSDSHENTGNQQRSHTLQSRERPRSATEERYWYGEDDMVMGTSSGISLGTCYRIPSGI